MEIQGCTCLVTGGSKGIGRALARLLLAEGARVTIAARNPATLAEAEGDLAGGDALLAVAGDVGRDEDAARMVAATVARFGRIDLLVNNAAVLTNPAPIAEVAPDVWAEVLRINVTGTANTIRHALTHMRTQGGGAIVNVSSTWGRSAAPRVAPYCASKFAVEALTQSLAGEAPPGVIAIAVNPGIIATEMLARAFEGDVSSFPPPEALAPAWRALFDALDAGWNGRSVDLASLA